MKKATFVGVYLVLGWASLAFAQGASAPADAQRAPVGQAEPAPAPVPSAGEIPAAPAADQAVPAPPPQAEGAPAAARVPALGRADIESRRHAIRMIEAVLSRAVLGGAEHLAEQLGSGNPNMSFFTGQARARGFILDGYGVFFHVEIPEMQTSLVMSVTTVERDVAVSSALDALHQAVAAFPDGAQKLQAEQALKTLQLQVGPMPQLVEPSNAGRDLVRAASTSVTEPLPSTAMPILRDPSGAYREAIKAALIDAMLEHSRGLNLRPDEWLSVAAQRGDSLTPNEIVTSPTLVLRIKGSDLALYDADRTRKDEIRQRVEVREF